MRWVTNALAMTLASCSDRTLVPIVPEALNFSPNRAVFTGTTRAINQSGGFGKDAVLRLSSQLRGQKG